MRKLAIVGVVILAPLLGASQCGGPQVVLPPDTKLPPFPADIRACFKRAGVAIEDREYTAGELYQKWGQDRVTIVALRKCGTRVEIWYETIRAKWR